MLRIGAHVSVAGGFINALKIAKEIGANTIQIFGASPVRWQAPLPDKKEALEFQETAQKMDIGPVFLHAPYLINLASPNGNLPAISRSLLQKHLEISNALGAEGVIFHIGSMGDREQDEAEKMVINSLKEILEKVSDGNLIIENSAGAGNLVGDQLDEVGRITKSVNNKRLKFCLDTAHIFESGVIESYSVENIRKLLRDIDSFLGKDKLCVIHLNDSKTPTGSNKDRHENIGEGYIGKEGFKNMALVKEFIKLPLIMEVPGFDDNGPDKKNIDIFKKIVNN